MISIPALAEKHLGRTIEGGHGVSVALKNPDGVTFSQTVDGRPLKGFVRRSYADMREARDGKEKTIVNAPAVKLRISSLPELPTTGADWLIGIPESPAEGAELEWYSLDPKKPVEVNKGTGTVKLYLAKMQEAAWA